MNCITYWKGGNDRLFTGTDVGVFFREGTEPWKPWNAGLPVTVVSDLEILDTVQILRAGTYGRGIWQTYLYPCPASGPATQEITSNETWTVPVTLDRSVFIRRNASLTIQTTVRFPILSKLMVEPGASLILDSNAILTNACSGMWLGIELWGDITKSQTTLNQALLVMRNGSIISNARIGVTTCRKDANGGIIWNTTGGMVQASGSIFSNNFKAVEFLSYPYLNKSTFTNVHFKTDGLFSDYTSKPQAFVSLLGVNNVRFLGCRFINYAVDTLNTFTMPPPEESGDGIVGIDAGFIVDERCTSGTAPCNLFEPSFFCGLNEAVKVENTIPVHPVKLSKSHFVINRHGIYLSGVNFAQINSNRFLLPYYTTTDTCYGLYLNASTGYCVQENNFSRVQHQLFYNYPVAGVIVNNSGGEPNEIYNNSFYSLQIGILAQRYNRNRNGSSGLNLKCNDFSFTRNDIAVTFPGPSIIPWGIKENQGSFHSITNPAGNTFSATHTPSYAGGFSDINNEGNWINYYYHADCEPDNLRMAPVYCTPNITLRDVDELYSKSVACPSHLPDPNKNEEDLIAGMSEAGMMADSITNLLSILTDGGNTQSITSDITFSTPSDALDLHAELLGMSPYLSDTVLKSAISRENVLDNELLTDILVANPQSSKSDSILDALENRIIPVTDAMMEDIMAGTVVTSEKEELECQLATHRMEQASYFNDLLRLYKTDTVNPNAKESLKSLLEQYDFPQAKYLLAFEYMAEGNATLAAVVLSTIPTQYDLNPEEAELHEDYEAYFAVLTSILDAGKTIFETDTLQRIILTALASDGTEPVQTLARNLLLANHYITYDPPFDWPNDNKSVSIRKMRKSKCEMRSEHFRFYPNPINQYLVVQYELNDRLEYSSDILIRIYNMEGIIKYEKKLDPGRHFHVVDCREFPIGYYIGRIIRGKSVVYTSKFIILH